MKVLQGRTNSDGLVHLNLGQFIAETETVGELAGLLGKSGYVRLERFDVPSAQDAIQLAVKVGVSLLDFSIIDFHEHFLSPASLRQASSRSSSQRSPFDELRVNGGFGCLIF
jgi:hypothetical protein